MLKLLIRRLAAITLSVFVLIGSPAAAQASTTVALDSISDLVNVVTIYPTTLNTQSQILSEVAKKEQATFSKTPGFQDSSILKAQDGSQVIALSQWKGKDLSIFQSYASEHVLNVATDQKPRTFACQVQHTETRSMSPSFQDGDVVMFSQFKLKPGKSQSELAMVVSQEMPAVLQMIPGLQWAAMCPSTDKSTIALLARWNSSEDFESLGKQPGFDQETNYWQDYADNEHGLYNVAQVIH
jgi:heme-degrading monooxygenase HmoA